MTASNSIDIDGQTGGVVSNFSPLEGTGAGSTTQDSIELEISAGLVLSPVEKISLAEASL